jgi:hypothetical protein
MNQPKEEKNQLQRYITHRFGGLTNAVKYLLSQGADVNAQGGWFGNALQATSFSGHEKMVELLLSKGADVSAQGGIFGNALQAALVSGHEKVVELLYGMVLYGRVRYRDPCTKQIFGKSKNRNPKIPPSFYLKSHM